MIFWSYSTAPPDCSLTRQSETAGRDLGVWDSGAEPFRLQKTAVHTSPADAGFVCLLSQVSSSLAPGLSPSGSRAFRPLLPFGSACSSFLLNVSTTRIHGWIGRGTGVYPREDNHAVLVASLRFRHGYRLAVHTLAALPPGLPGQASELYYENVR